MCKRKDPHAGLSKAEKDRFVVVDAAGTVEVIHRKILEAIHVRLGIL